MGYIDAQKQVVRTIVDTSQAINLRKDLTNVGRVSPGRLNDAVIRDHIGSSTVSTT
jgi:hypothetical protein